MARPLPLVVPETCDRCGSEMKKQYATVCGTNGKAEHLPLPLTCSDSECRRAGQVERDEAALKRAIERGIITP